MNHKRFMFYQFLLICLICTTSYASHAQTFQFVPDVDLLEIQDGCYLHAKNQQAMACIDLWADMGYVTLDLHLLTLSKGGVNRKTYTLYKGGDGDISAVNLKVLHEVNAYFKKHKFTLQEDSLLPSSHHRISANQILVSVKGMRYLVSTDQFKLSNSDCCRWIPQMYELKGSNQIVVKLIESCYWLNTRHFEEGSKESKKFIAKYKKHTCYDPDYCGDECGDRSQVDYTVVQSTQAKKIDWFCLCYQERYKGAVVNATACRKTLKQCRILENKASTKGSKVIVKDSLIRSCEPVMGKHPSKTLKSKKTWLDSARPGATWNPTGCLIPQDSETSFYILSQCRKGIF